MDSQDPNRHPRESEGTVLSAVHTVRQARPEVPAREDVVIDFDGKQIADLMGLSMILTARQIVNDRSAVVWLKDVPLRTWALLRALGMEQLFALFPESTEQPT